MVSLKYVGKINCFIYYFIVSGNVPLIVSFFQSSAGAGPEYERFLARTKTVEQKPEWNVSGINNTYLKYDSRLWPIILYGYFKFYREKLSLKVQKNIFENCLKLEDLFAEGYIPCLEPGVEGEVVLTRGQVRCLLSHMLLCTLTRDTWHKHWVTLQPWIVRDNKPCVSYLACLLDYFENSGNCFFYLTTLIYQFLRYWPGGRDQVQKAESGFAKRSSMARFNPASGEVWSCVSFQHWKTGSQRGWGRLR